MPSNMGYMYPVYPIINGIVIVLVAIPILIHWKAGNLATTALGLWIIGLEIIFSVGTVVWHNNIRNDHTVWGDIVNFYQAAWPSAIAACNFCIQYRLWTIARARTVFITKRDKRRQLYSTLGMCIGLPIFVALLHYIVQGHRYDLFEDLGPLITTYNVTLAYPLFFAIDPTIVLVTGVFSGMTIHLLLARRRELDTILNYGSSNINRGKYIRLLCLASVSIALHLPFSIWVTAANLISGVYPWISWEQTQLNWIRIIYYPRKVMELHPQMVITFSTEFWSVTLTASVYFAFFGFGEEARSYYVNFIGLVLRQFGVQHPKPRRRKAVKRTLLDVLLGRPGRPGKFTLSTQSWTLQPSSIVPSTLNAAKHGHAASGATTSIVAQHSAGIDEVFSLDISNVDFLNPTKAHSQVEAHTDARVDHAVEVIPSLTGPVSPRRSSMVPGIGASNDVANSRPAIEESAGVADEKRNPEPEVLPQAEPGREVEDVDLEAQEQAEEATRREQERIRLELNPELTCQITF